MTKRKLKGVHLPDSPAPGPVADNMRRRKWVVYEVGSWKLPTTGVPSSGGQAMRLNRLGTVSAQDLSEAQGKARMNWGPSVDYIEPLGTPDGSYPKSRKGEK